LDALRLVVRGRVQGVGFRWFVRESARAAGLAGWVRNNPDGSVELAASGPASALEALRAAVREGPAGARVTEVDELPVEPGTLPHPFTVHR
jgi:acylphosphatase